MLDRVLMNVQDSSIRSSNFEEVEKGGYICKKIKNYGREQDNHLSDGGRTDAD